MEGAGADLHFLNLNVEWWERWPPKKVGREGTKRGGQSHPRLDGGLADILIPIIMTLAL